MWQRKDTRDYMLAVAEICPPCSKAEGLSKSVMGKASCMYGEYQLEPELSSVCQKNKNKHDKNRKMDLDTISGSKPIRQSGRFVGHNPQVDPDPNTINDCYSGQKKTKTRLLPCNPIGQRVGYGDNDNKMARKGEPDYWKGCNGGRDPNYNILSQHTRSWFPSPPVEDGFDTPKNLIGQAIQVCTPD